MQSLVPVIVIIIILLQVFFFLKNLWRMWQFRRVFNDEHNSWSISINTETHLVDGVSGDGNTIFRSIVNSINKYLGNNVGSVIDFGLLKDAVDRHCDSVEDDIATQTPIPLYLGLAGTMAGVIIGLWDLLNSNAVLTLMGSGAGQIDESAQNAAAGIDGLLSGVAWAMVSSICGIILTTLNSILFKSCKLREEAGKNTFLAWMQSELLPKLPTDTSQALNNLVGNLNRFNKAFAWNTSKLENTLQIVNASYEREADIFRAVHDLDVIKMASANTKVLRELQNCTDKLEAFNEYLSEIQGYTDAIHRFESQFNKEAERLHILEEIRDFFQHHKSAMAKTVADADNALSDALQDIKNKTADNVSEMHNRFVEQSESFKEILKQEKEAFEQFMSQLNAQFSTQISAMPELGKRLDEISRIPDRLNKLIDQVERSNSRLAREINDSLKQTLQAFATMRPTGGVSVVAKSSTPQWMKYVGLSAVVIIAVACIPDLVALVRKLCAFFII